MTLIQPRVYCNLETFMGEIRHVLALKDQNNILWPGFKRPFKWRAGGLIKLDFALNWRSEGSSD